MEEILKEAGDDPEHVIKQKPQSRLTRKEVEAAGEGGRVRDRALRGRAHGTKSNGRGY